MVMMVNQWVHLRMHACAHALVPWLISMNKTSFGSPASCDLVPDAISSACASAHAHDSAGQDSNEYR